MKPTLRNALYGALILCCAAFAAFIFLNGKGKSTLPELKERQGALAEAPEWATTQANYNKLTAELKTKPTEAKALLQLAKVFMQEARVTGDYTYYNQAALDMINSVLAKDAQNFDATCLKAMVLLSQHRFADGKALAMQGMQMNPYNSFIYGLLIDANVELGDYPEAIKMADKMVSIRPDIRSYSRVSYLREIHGDVPGSLEAIKMAVSAGFPGNEDIEWARMVQAHLLEDSGKIDEAEQVYKLALTERPNYPFALAGLGKIARYRKDYPGAIAYYEQAKAVMSDASFFEELIDLYRLNNQPDQSATCAKATIDAVSADNTEGAKKQEGGHFAERQLAFLYLKTNQLDKALEFAQIDQQRRPKNIDACEMLAWVLYKKGDVAQAATFLPTMRGTNSQNPELLVKSGLIMVANGQKEQGAALIQKGMSLKPYMEESLAAEAKMHLKA